MKHQNKKQDRKHSPSWMIFAAILGLTLMPCAAQDESTMPERMPERMRERSKQMQEKMSQHFHRAWSGMRDAMPGRKGSAMADASMDLREQSDSYVMRLHLPERDINLVEVGIADGRNLRVTAPASGTLGAYEQNITLEEVTPGAKPEVEKRPNSGLVIIRISKTPSEKKPAPEANATPGKELPAATDPWDVRMLEHMKRMGRDMDNMIDHTGAKHWLDRSSFNSAYDLQEEEDRYVVRAYLPERSAEQVKVSVREQNLIIEAIAEKTSEIEAGKDGKATMRHMRQYSQSIALPGPVDGDHIEIERKEGLLLIRIPKIKASESASGKPSGK
jgi:HSP20 family protein